MTLRPIQEVAKEEGVNVLTLYRLIRAGKIARYKRAGDRRTFVDTEQVREVRGFRRVAGPEPGAEPVPAQPVEAKPVVALAVVSSDGRVLMTRRRFPEGRFAWGFPSGNVEPGETPEAAAVREASEEVGLTIEVEGRLGERVHPVTGRQMIYFRCRIIEGVPHLVDHDELAEVRWVTLAEADELAAPQGGIFEPVREHLLRLSAAAE